MHHDTLTRAIDEAARASTFSGAVSVIADGIRVKRAYGFADRANRIPNTVTTRFGIASGTKFITALTVGALIDQGVLSADARVFDLLSGRLPCIGPDATVSQLLEHTSGVYDYYDEELVEDFDTYRVEIPWSDLTTPRDYLPLFEGHRMKFEPGERFSYSNGGYILLGILVEEATGRLFREVARDLVLEPACMERSGFFAFNRLPGETACGYVELPDGGWQTNVFQLPRIGASDGGMFATVDDLDRLWRAFAHDAIVSPATRAGLTTPRHGLSPTLEYGRGLYVFSATSPPTVDSSSVGDAGGGWMITGSDAGVGFESRHLPEYGLTATVVSNTTDGHLAVTDAVRAVVRDWPDSNPRGTQ